MALPALRAPLHAARGISVHGGAARYNGCVPQQLSGLHVALLYVVCAAACCLQLVVCWMLHVACCVAFCVLHVALHVALRVALRQAERQQFRIAALLDERQAMLAAGPLTRHATHIPLIVAYNLTLAFVLAGATADPPRLLAAWRTWRVACCICNRAALCVVSACRYAASCSDLVSCVGQIRTGYTLRRLLPLPTSCAILPSSGSRLRQPPAGSASPRPSLN